MYTIFGSVPEIFFTHHPPTSPHSSPHFSLLFCCCIWLHPDHSATMNDPDDFGLGNIGPDTLETENQQEQEPEQESNTSTQQNTATTIHQLATMNDLDDFGFGDVSPNTLEQNINKNKNKNRIQAHNKILLQPLLRRRDEVTQYRRNFVIYARSDDDRRMDNHRERHAMV